MTRVVAFLIGLSLSTSLFGFEFVTPKDKAVVIAQADRLPYVEEFRSVFPNATLDVGPPQNTSWTPVNEKEVMETLYVWVTVGLYERYVLTMAIPFKLADDRIRIATVKEPNFSIQAVEYIVVSENGQAHITFDTKQSREFGYGQWRKFMEQGLQLDVIGITLTKDKPLQHFDKVWPAR